MSSRMIRLSHEPRHFRGMVQAGLTIALAVAISGCEQPSFLSSGEQSKGPTTAELAAVAATSAALTTPAQHRVGPGDVLNIFVFDNPQISQQVKVGPDGRFRYPLIGEVNAAGHTLGELEETLVQRLGQNILFPQVSVSLAEPGGFRVYVNGEVLSPGVLKVNEPITLVQAVAMAGGFTAFAARDEIIIYNPARADGKRRTFNYDHFVNTPGTPDIVLEPGDTVIVR